MSPADRSPNLVAWQWGLYPRGHRARANLLMHAATVPLFWAGTVLVLAAPVVSWWTAPVGLLVMVSAFGAQAGTHTLEGGRPVPFSGPFDVVARAFCEQWVNFPRYVLTGGFARAWREAAPGGQHPAPGTSRW